jgi:hypothetical protein
MVRITEYSFQLKELYADFLEPLLNPADRRGSGGGERA